MTPDSSIRTVRCLCCLKAMTVDVRIPDDAVVFDATGNYGSTQFDCTGCTVRAIVCDKCFVERLDFMVGYAERTERTTKWFTAREAVEETAYVMFGEDPMASNHDVVGDVEPLAENFRASGEMVDAAAEKIAREE